MEQETFDTMCIAADLTAEQKDAAWHAYSRAPERFDRLARRTLKSSKRYPRLNPRNYLALAVCAAALTRQEYRKRGIPDVIFYDTMGDIRVWCDNYAQKHGKVGLDNFGWIVNHLRLKLFRLGRLQFQFIKFYYPLFAQKSATDASPYKRGQNALFVHIPQGSPLTEDACDKSFGYARRFFRKRFSEYRPQAFITESWLLGSCNRQLLGEESNIVKFAGRFTIMGERKDVRQTAERIFGYDLPDRVEDYPEDTRLRAAAKRRLLQGDAFYCGFGYIPFDDGSPTERKDEREN